MKKCGGLMGIAAPKKFRSVMYRLLLTFMLLLTPILFMGLTIYHVGVSKLDHQIYHLLQNQVSMRIEIAEKQMTLAQTQMHQLCNERDLQRLAGRAESMSRYESFLVLNTLQERLKTICDANPLLRQVTMYLPKIGYMIYGDTLIWGDTTISGWDQGEFEQAWNISANHPSKLLYTDGSLLYASQIPLPTSMDVQREPRILFELEYDRTDILDSFQGLLDSVETSAALIFADGGFLGAEAEGDSWKNAVSFLRNSEAGGEKILDLSDAEAYICCVWSEQLGAWCMAYAPRAEAFKEMNTFRSFISVLMMLFVLVLLIYGVSAYREVHKPLKLLTEAFDRLAQGDMGVRIQYNKANEFSYLSDRFNRMVQQLKDTMRALYEQRILMQQAQIKQMQAQINPHFLYNCLFILNNMVAMEDCEAAALMSQSLGEYFQYIARDARDTVSLCEELKHVRSYIEVQRIRFDRRLHIEFPEIPAETGNVMVPRLCVQPIVENAFVHALERSKRGELIVRICREEAAFRVEVENTGCSAQEEWLEELRAALDDDSPDRELTGLINVHRRLRLTYGEGLRFERLEPDRLRVILTFPMGERMDSEPALSAGKGWEEYE